MRFLPPSFLSFAICVSAWLFPSPDVPAAAPSQPHDFTVWNRLIHEELDGAVAGGYAYEILQNGKIVAWGQNGFARAPWERLEPAMPLTIFKQAPLASISKTITAVAMMKLWDEKGGRLLLDAPFWPYVKRFAPNPDPAVKKITIRELLMHRSGIARNPDVTTHAELGELLKRPLTHRPGQRFDYQNNNYYIARVVLEQIAHDSYGHYVQKHVLKPMGILHMETRSESEAPMCGYTDADEKEPGYPFAWDCTRWAGGAGWYGSVHEMAMFIHGLQARTILSEQATRILFHDALGFDWETPCYGKGGDWVFQDQTGSGEVHSAVCCFPDGIEAAMVINSTYDQGPLSLLEDTWEHSRVRIARKPANARKKTEEKLAASDER